jgi:hypothetical protein
MRRRDRLGSLNSFLGSWSLVSLHDTLPSAEVQKPFGESPMGLILYQADGHMSAQLSVARPKRLVSEDPLCASADEAANAWQTYFGYWGTFQVDADKGVVLHRVEGCSFPNWIGAEQVRHFRFDGADRLILEAQSGSVRSNLIWQRRNQ